MEKAGKAKSALLVFFLPLDSSVQIKNRRTLVRRGWTSNSNFQARYGLLHGSMVPHFPQDAPLSHQSLSPTKKERLPSSPFTKETLAFLRRHLDRILNRGFSA